MAPLLGHRRHPVAILGKRRVKRNDRWINLSAKIITKTREGSK